MYFQISLTGLRYLNMLILSKILPKEEEATTIEGLSIVGESIRSLWSAPLNKHIVTTSTDIYVLDSLQEIVPEIMSTSSEEIPPNNLYPLAGVVWEDEEYVLVCDDSTGTVFKYDINTSQRSIIGTDARIIGNASKIVVEIDYTYPALWDTRIHVPLPEGVTLTMNLGGWYGFTHPTDGRWEVASGWGGEFLIVRSELYESTDSDVLRGNSYIELNTLDGSFEKKLPTLISDPIAIRVDRNGIIFIAEDLVKESLSLFIVKYIYNSRYSYDIDMTRIEGSRRDVDVTVEYIPLGRNFFLGMDPPPIDYKVDSIRAITNVWEEANEETYTCRILFDNPPYVLEGKVDGRYAYIQLADNVILLDMAGKKYGEIFTYGMIPYVLRSNDPEASYDGQLLRNIGEPDAFGGYQYTVDFAMGNVSAHETLVLNAWGTSLTLDITSRGY